MKPRALIAFNAILQRYNLSKVSYKQAHRRFPRVVLRDTLLRLGIGMEKAERMVRETHGTARARFNQVKAELREMGKYGDN